MVFEFLGRGRRHPLLLFFLNTSMFTFLFDMLNFSFYFQLFLLLSLSIHVCTWIFTLPKLTNVFFQYTFLHTFISFFTARYWQHAAKVQFLLFSVYKHRRVCREKTTNIYQLEGSEILKKCKDLHIETSLQTVQCCACTDNGPNFLMHTMKNK